LLTARRQALHSIPEEDVESVLKEVYPPQQLLRHEGRRMILDVVLKDVSDDQAKVCGSLFLVGSLH
jgi:hypothetical protein